MTGWVLHCSKTFTSVFITTDKLCEGFGQGLATVSQLSQQLPLLIRNWPTNRSDFTRVSRYFTREICRVSICIWTCSHTFYCIWSSVCHWQCTQYHQGAWLISSQSRFFHRNHNVPVSSHCPSQVPRMSRQEGDTFLYKNFTDSTLQCVQKQHLHTVPARSGKQWQRWTQTQGSWTPGRCSSGHWRGHLPARCGSAACNGAWSAGWSGTDKGQGFHVQTLPARCKSPVETPRTPISNQGCLLGLVSPPSPCSDSTGPCLP